MTQLTEFWMPLEKASLNLLSLAVGRWFHHLSSASTELHKSHQTDVKIFSFILTSLFESRGPVICIAPVSQLMAGTTTQMFLFTSTSSFRLKVALILQIFPHTPSMRALASWTWKRKYRPSGFVQKEVEGDFVLELWPQSAAHGRPPSTLSYLVRGFHLLRRPMRIHECTYLILVCHQALARANVRGLRRGEGDKERKWRWQKQEKELHKKRRYRARGSNEEIKPNKMRNWSARVPTLATRGESVCELGR